MLSKRNSAGCMLCAALRVRLPQGLLSEKRMHESVSRGHEDDQIISLPVGCSSRLAAYAAASTLARTTTWDLLPLMSTAPPVS